MSFRCRNSAGRLPTALCPLACSRATSARPGGGFDRIDDRLIAGAAAVVPREMFTDALTIRLALGVQEVLGGHQHPRRAEAALQRVALAERGLEVRYLSGVRQTLDRLDRG